MKLSHDELQILQNKEFLLLKNEVTGKVIACLAGIERCLREEVAKSSFPFPERTLLKTGKISKGEQYRGLPYFILDYPRLFSKTEVFSFRTMLWWGNHFGCTFHISGACLQDHKDAFLRNATATDEVFFCVNKHPWEYHFENDNFLPLNQLKRTDILEHIEKNDFIKIGAFIPVKRWNEYESFTIKCFARFLRYFY